MEPIDDGMQLADHPGIASQPSRQHVADNILQPVADIAQRRYAGRAGTALERVQRTCDLIQWLIVGRIVLEQRERMIDTLQQLTRFLGKRRGQFRVEIVIRHCTGDRH